MRSFIPDTDINKDHPVQLDLGWSTAPRFFGGWNRQCPRQKNASPLRDSKSTLSFPLQVGHGSPPTLAHVDYYIYMQYMPPRCRCAGCSVTPALLQYMSAAAWRRHDGPATNCTTNKQADETSSSRRPWVFCIRHRQTHRRTEYRPICGSNSSNSSVQQHTPLVGQWLRRVIWSSVIDAAALNVQPRARSAAAKHRCNVACDKTLGVEWVKKVGRA